MSFYAWDNVQNFRLRAGRGIGFEDAVFHIERGDLLDVLERLNPERRSGPPIFVVRRDHDVYFGAVRRGRARRTDV